LSIGLSLNLLFLNCSLLHSLHDSLPVGPIGCFQNFFLIDKTSCKKVERPLVHLLFHQRHRRAGRNFDIQVSLNRDLLLVDIGARIWMHVLNNCRAHWVATLIKHRLTLFINVRFHVKLKVLRCALIIG